MKANADKFILFLSVRHSVGDRYSRADCLVAAYFRAGGEVDVPHLFPALHRDFVARDRDDFSSHLGSLRECPATKREACRSDRDDDFIFVMALNPGILPNASFHARRSLDLSVRRSATRRSGRCLRSVKAIAAAAVCCDRQHPIGRRSQSTATDLFCQGQASALTNTPQVIVWGAHAPSRALFGALAELPSYCFGGSGIVLNPTRARYSSACNKSFPARSMIFSRLSIEETSSSCSVRNHWRKLIVI
jgi:hypothetical protein